MIFLLFDIQMQIDYVSRTPESNPAKFSILTLVLTHPGCEKERDRWLRQYKSTHPLTFFIDTDDVKERLKRGKAEDILPSGEEKKVYDFEIHQDIMKTITSILNSPRDYGLDTGLGPEIMVIVNCTSNVDDWVGYKNLGSTLLVAKLFRHLTPLPATEVIPDSPRTSGSLTPSSSSSDIDESDHLNNPTPTSTPRRRKHKHMNKYKPPVTGGGVVDFTHQGPDVEAELRGMFLSSNERYMQFIFNFIL